MSRTSKLKHPLGKYDTLEQEPDMIPFEMRGSRILFDFGDWTAIWGLSTDINFDFTAVYHWLSSYPLLQVPDSDIADSPLIGSEFLLVDILKARIWQNYANARKFPFGFLWNHASSLPSIFVDKGTPATLPLGLEYPALLVESLAMIFYHHQHSILEFRKKLLERS